jgi:hypothetical protein
MFPDCPDSLAVLAVLYYTLPISLISCRDFHEVSFIAHCRKMGLCGKKIRGCIKYFCCAYAALRNP